MKAGTNLFHRIVIPIDYSLLESAVITYGNGPERVLLQKRYPDEAELMGGWLCVPLTQEDTLAIHEGLKAGEKSVHFEVQLNFAGGAVAKTNMSRIPVCGTLATEAVPGNWPDAESPDIVSVLETDEIVVINRGGGGSYIIGSGLKLDEATNTLSVDTADEVEADNTRPITSAAVHETVGNIEALLKII